MTTTLPEFDLYYGYLPPGIHNADIETFYYRCAAPGKGQGLFPSPRRAALFIGYRRLVEAFELVGLPSEQWIGGSYVSKTAEPDDIDLVNFCDARAYQALPDELRAMIRRYIYGEETAKHCHCDSYFVPKPPTEHQLSEEFLEIRRYWQTQLGTDEQGREKGIICCVIASPYNDADTPEEEESDASAS